MGPSGWWLLVVLTGGGLALRLWNLPAGLPHFPFPDEPTVVRMAVGFGTGDLNPHFFGYPTLWSYILAIVFGITFLVARVAGLVGSVEAFKTLYFTDPTLFYVTGRLLAALVGAATIPLACALGARLHGPRVGLFAAAALAVAPLHVQYSHSLVLDGPLAFAITAAVLFILRFDEAPSWGRLVVASLAAGLATSIKYPGLALSLPLAAAVLGCRESLPGRLLALATSAGLFVAGFFVGTPYALLEFRGFLEDVRKPIATALRPYPGVDPGIDGLAYYVTYVLPLGAGAGVVLAALAGLVWVTVLALVRRDLRWLLPACFVVPYFLVFAFSQTPFARYLVPLLPFVAVYAGFTLEGLVGWLWRPSWLPAVAWALALAILLAWPATATLTWIASLTRADTRSLAKAWIERHVPSEAVVAVDRYPVPLATSLEYLRRQIRALESRRGEDREAARQLGRWQEKHRVLSRPGAAGPAYAVYALSIGDPEPSQVDRLPYSLPALRAQGVRYVVISSAMAERFRLFPGLYPREALFHENLEAAGRLVFEVDPLDPACRVPASVIASPDVMLQQLVLPSPCVRYNGPAIRVFELTRASAP